MSLNPEIAAFLDLVEANQTDATQAFHQQMPAQARQAFEQSSARMRWQVPQVLSRDLSYPTRDGDSLAVRIYTPITDSKQALPVTVFLHGGGFVVGSLDSHDGICREFCHRTPCAVVAVEYRRAPEFKFPTALHDAADALTWLAQQAGALNLDSSRLALAGDSVGATLATVLAIEAAASAQALQPCLQLLCYPVTDASRSTESRELFSEGYLLENPTLEWFYDHYARTAEDRADWRFSPLLAPNLGGVAPVHLALAGFDPLIDEGHAYAQRLQASGVAVQCKEYTALVHDFLRMPMVTGKIESVYQELTEVLREALYP
ncbi:alpha/beta hydrolase [Pseudomonas sp. SWRI111]|uniref:alpha/beta hydrolase n=1 Tax=Pseudomonas sp. SWRI111 TaxID=2745507 RepID=UPI001646F352|nr:alpha/beta hydrolase [Pseudomonas sp. SWRI111]MBC3209858.1 alpha/beta hydrolase [Pseudomonas sp. SWRI111]